MERVRCPLNWGTVGIKGDKNIYLQKKVEFFDWSVKWNGMFFVVLKLFRFAFTFLFFNMLPFCNRPLSQQVWIEVIPKVKRKQRS